MARNDTGKAVEAPMGSQAASSVRGGAVDRTWQKSKLIEAFDLAASRCQSAADLRSLLQDVTQELGYHYFALLHHASLNRHLGQLIRFDNYPLDWQQEIHEAHLFEHDPIHAASVRTNIGFKWDDVERFVTLTGTHRAILMRSRRFGLVNGFTVPANVPGEPNGSCSFASPSSRSISKAGLQCAELIGAHAFFTARRLQGLPSAACRPHLSRRERQCLRLLASGKTDWEIGAILGLSPETVRQYVKHARASYDVVSRAQLVAFGLRDAWISFDDVS
jgi:LuxR family quorum-sensing system transcriptional regulator CciR